MSISIRQSMCISSSHSWESFDYRCGMNHGCGVGNGCGVDNRCGGGNRVYKSILVVIFGETFKADGPKASFGSDQISKPGVHGACCGS